MSGQLRTIKNRIRSIESTKKITRAMEMVSAAKLKRFQKLLHQATPYTQALEKLLANILGSSSGCHHPLLVEREEKQCALLVVTSDTGLCGSFNMDLIQETRRFIESRSKKPLLIGLGKIGINALSRDHHTWHTMVKDTKTADIESAVKKIELLMEALFRERVVDAVYVTRAKFVTQSAYRATTEKILPFSVQKKSGDLAHSLPYIFEPSPEFLFTRLIPMIFEVKVRDFFLESFVAEQTARMEAMHLATKNAGELIDSLTLTRNKIRQAAITKELIEIVSGSRALKT